MRIKIVNESNNKTPPPYTHPRKERKYALHTIETRFKCEKNLHFKNVENEKRYMDIMS